MWRALTSSTSCELTLVTVYIWLVLCDCLTQILPYFISKYIRNPDIHCRIFCQVWGHAIKVRWRILLQTYALIISSSNGKKNSQNPSIETEDIAKVKVVSFFGTQCISRVYKRQLKVLLNQYINRLFGFYTAEAQLDSTRQQLRASAM